MTIKELNQAIQNGRIEKIIKEEEARHQSTYSIVASKIATRGARIVLISGPSSSGKTTSSMRIGAELARIGIKSMQMSLDNYFVERKKTPKDKNGNFDFEAIGAVNVKKFNSELRSLLNGESLQLQKFDFLTGLPGINEVAVSIDPHAVVIVEGLHALNPTLMQNMDDLANFKVYLSALSPLQLDPMCEIRPRDNIMLRRLIRDNKYRGRTASETLLAWPAVRRGEQLHIIPFEDESDIIINTALNYEMAVLKTFAIPLLVEARNLPNAKRLLQTLECIEPIGDELIPCDSVLREYIGGSCFEY